MFCPFLQQCLFISIFYISVSFLHLFPPPFFSCYLTCGTVFLLLTAFFTNMVRCYIRTPLKLTFLNSVTFLLPIFLTSFDASGLIIKYWHWTSAICKREHTWRGQPNWYDLKKLTSKTKTLLLVYTREHAYVFLVLFSVHKIYYM